MIREILRIGSFVIFILVTLIFVLPQLGINFEVLEEPLDYIILGLSVYTLVVLAFSAIMEDYLEDSNWLEIGIVCTFWPFTMICIVIFEVADYFKKARR